MDRDTHTHAAMFVTVDRLSVLKAINGHGQSKKEEEEETSTIDDSARWASQWNEWVVREARLD